MYEKNVLKLTSCKILLIDGIASWIFKEKSELLISLVSYCYDYGVCNNAYKQLYIIKEIVCPFQRYQFIVCEFVFVEWLYLVRISRVIAYWKTTATTGKWLRTVHAFIETLS